MTEQLNMDRIPICSLQSVYTASLQPGMHPGIQLEGTFKDTKCRLRIIIGGNAVDGQLFTFPA